MAVNLRELPERLRIAAGERLRALASAPIVRKSIDRANTIAERESERLGRLIAPTWQVAHGWYSKREQREKSLLRILGVVLGATLIGFALTASVISRRPCPAFTHHRPATASSTSRPSAVQ